MCVCESVCDTNRECNDENPVVKHQGHNRRGDRRRTDPCDPASKETEKKKKHKNMINAQRKSHHAPVAASAVDDSPALHTRFEPHKHVLGVATNEAGRLLLQLLGRRLLLNRTAELVSNTQGENENRQQKKKPPLTMTSCLPRGRRRKSRATPTANFFSVSLTPWTTRMKELERQ
jgi:hypothetical protein